MFHDNPRDLLCWLMMTLSPLTSLPIVKYGALKIKRRVKGVVKL